MQVLKFYRNLSDQSDYNDKITLLITGNIIIYHIMKYLLKQIVLYLIYLNMFIYIKEKQMRN